MQSVCSAGHPVFFLYVHFFHDLLPPSTFTLLFFFNHYIYHIYWLPAIYNTHLLSIETAFPNQFIPNFSHPPFFPPLNSFSVHSRNISFNFYSVKGIVQPALYIEKNISARSSQSFRAIFPITFLFQVKAKGILASLFSAPCTLLSKTVTREVYTAVLLHQSPNSSQIRYHESLPEWGINAAAAWDLGAF